MEFIHALLALTLFVIAVAFYLLPTIIAFNKKKDSKWAIFLLNLFLGATIVGWLIALVWALNSDRQPQQIIVNATTNNAFADLKPITRQESLYSINQPKDKVIVLRELKQLLDDGVLTEEEFNMQKAKVLAE